MTQQIINIGALPNDHTGDSIRVGGQKINDNFTELYAGIGSTTVTLPNIVAPALPVSGGVIYVDSNGALHFQSQWYDSTLPGGKFNGDATRPWFTTGIGFGHTVTGSGNNQPNVRIQKGNSSTLSGAALSLLDTIGASVTTQETAVIIQVICPTGAQYDGKLAVGMQVEVDKNAGQHGNPFAANFVAKDLTGSITAMVGTETDIVTSNPDTAGVRVISDNIAREGIAQTLGLTTVEYGIRSRPSDNAGVTTGPVKLLNAFAAYTEASYPGASIGDAFSSDGGATNGLHLISTAVAATTNAQGTSGTNTLTFAIGNVPAASPGAWISDGGEAFIPANTTITGVSTIAGVTTVTMSANQTGNVANGQAVTITQAYDTGILLNGNFNVAASSITTQYGLEETLQNGLVLGAPNGGAKGVGTLNAVNVYGSGLKVSRVIASAAVANAVTGGGSIAPAHTGDSNEFNLAVCTIPANTVPAGSMLKITAVFYRNAVSTNQVNMTVRDSTSSGAISGGTAYTSSVSTNSVVSFTAVYYMWHPTTSSQMVPFGSGGTVVGNSTVVPSTGAIDRTGTTYLNFNGKNVTSSSDTVGLYAYTVELLAP